MTARNELFGSGKLKVDESPASFRQDLIEGLRLGLIAMLAMLFAAFFFSGIIHPLFAFGNVEETVMDVLTRLALLAMPFVAYIAAASVARRYSATNIARALLLALTSTIILYAAISAGHYVLELRCFCAEAVAADDPEPNGCRRSRRCHRRREAPPMSLKSRWAMSSRRSGEIRSIWQPSTGV